MSALFVHIYKTTMSTLRTFAKARAAAFPIFLPLRHERDNNSAKALQLLGKKLKISREVEYQIPAN